MHLTLEYILHVLNMDLGYASNARIVTDAVQGERAKMIGAIRIAANMMFVVNDKGNTVLKKDFSDRMKALVICGFGYSVEIPFQLASLFNNCKIFVRNFSGLTVICAQIN